ncbi:hypothetical protein AURDEDRAFT_137262 [Auricularia subglabra TFB-10046 SS5]|nr:hypothetical protein AURDEDRAFT_137262 [Auricularia subglabra TFB-10046 SS5]
MTTMVQTLASLRVSKHNIKLIKSLSVTTSFNFPNCSIQSRPLLIYHGAFDPDSATPSAIEGHLKSLGVVEPQWRCTIYPTAHFHSTTLAARLCFGEDENRSRVEEVFGKGDVIVVPAGVSHRLLQDLNANGDAFEMVGSYPRGCDWNMC